MGNARREKSPSFARMHKAEPYATGHDAESTGRKCVCGEKARQGGRKEQDSGICDRNSTILGPTRLPTRSLGAFLRLTKVGLQPTILLSRLDLLISTFRGFDWPCSLALTMRALQLSLLTRKPLDVEGKGYCYAAFACFPPSSRTAETLHFGKTRFPSFAPGSGDVGPINHRRRSWNGH